MRTRPTLLALVVGMVVGTPALGDELWFKVEYLVTKVNPCSGMCTGKGIPKEPKAAASLIFAGQAGRDSYVKAHIGKKTIAARIHWPKGKAGNICIDLVDVEIGKKQGLGQEMSQVFYSSTTKLKPGKRFLLGVNTTTTEKGTIHSGWALSVTRQQPED